MDDKNVISEIRRDYIKALLEKGKRVDDRDFKDLRKIKIEKGIIGTAEGSAKVSLGKTSVCIGVKSSVGKPYPNSPEEGVLSTGSDLIPMASPAFDVGPPDPTSIELARVVDRGIREGGCIDLKKLVIEPREKVWMINLDIHVLDYDGNLIDASGLGAVAALMNTEIRASDLGMRKDFKLAVDRMPIPVTIAKIDDFLLVDPGLDEEWIADARLTVTTDDDGNVRAIQKGLHGSFSKKEVLEAIELSMELGRDIRDMVREDD